MTRILRGVLALLTVCLLAGSCQILTWTLVVPGQVAAGSIFVMEVEGTTNAGPGTCVAVVQFPVGFEVVSAHALAVPSQTPFPGGGVRDDPNVLAAYTPEAGHYLTSFQGMSGPAEHVNSYSARLAIYVRAPAAAGSHQIKLALGVFDFGAQQPYQHQHPAGITDFASITATAHSRSIQVLLTPPAPPFTLASTSHWSFDPLRSFVMGDLDADGRDDLVEKRAAGLRAYLARDNGWFDITGNLPLFGPQSNLNLSGIGDFDGDGFGDVLIGGTTGSVVTYLIFGSGGPLWTLSPALALVGGSRTASADVNADGRPDVIIRTATAILVLRVNADRTVTSMANGLSAADILLVSDLDGDRVAEMLLWMAGGLVKLWHSDGQGNWSVVGNLAAGVLTFSGFPPSSADGYLAIDLDGDGVKEVTRSGSTLAYRYLGSTTAPLPTQPIHFQRAVAIDYDRDGRSDVLLQNAWPGPVELWRNTGGAFVNVPLPTAASFGNQLAAAQLVTADIDGDSFPDAAASLPEGLLIWRNTVTGGARYGSACSAPGFAAPDLSVQGTVAPGQTPTLQLTGSFGNGVGFVWAGLSKRTMFGVPLLPLDLGWFGAPGCTMLAEPLVLIGFVADAAGTVMPSMPLPNLPSIQSLTFFTQGAVWAPGANSFGLLFSQGLALKMQ